MLVSLKNISKKHADSQILDDVTLNIEDTDKIAILGINGTGKTTLLNIIAGKSVYEGNIIYKKNIRISYLSQNPEFDFENNVTDIIKELEKDKEVNDYEIKSVLSRFGITDFNKKLKYFSGGQIKRLALSLTLLKPCDLLIMDEPTNHLDNTMIDYLEKYLQKYNRGLVLVTHDRYFLERIVNKIYEIDRTALYEYEGNYSKYLEEKTNREERMLVEQHKRKKFLKKELEWVNASPSARSTKQKSRLQRFEELSNVKDFDEVNSVQMINVNSRLGKKTIELENISKSYDDLKLFDDFSYIFKRTDRIGIIGDNGVGKTTLLNIISKQIPPSEGTVTFGDTIRIAYFKQGTDDMDESLKVIDYINETAQEFKTNDETLSSRNLLNRFLFDKKLQYTYISRLSGGQKRRLYLLKVLLNRPNVLILDEPTNDLDIETLQILEDYLDSFDGIVITVSHDRYFLDRICTGLFVLKNRTITHHNGGYSANIDSASTRDKAASSAKYVRKHQVKLSYHEKKEYNELEKRIDFLENEIENIENSMNNMTDFSELNSLSMNRDKLNKELDKSSERYFELLEKLENSKQ